jgi:subfamily B ATP-binding cassette protein MsbA
MQEVAQGGVQGFREVKLLNLEPEIRSTFQDAADRWVTNDIKLARNTAFLNNFYNFSSAVVLFAVVYIALQHTTMTVGSLGVFLFAMLRLAPRVSNINSILYSVEGTLPHLTRILDLRADLEVQTDEASAT